MVSKISALSVLASAAAYSSSRVVVSIEDGVSAAAASSAELAALSLDLVSQSTNDQLKETLMECLGSAMTYFNVGMQVIDGELCGAVPEDVCSLFEELAEETGREISCELSKEIISASIPNDPEVSKQWGMKRVGMENVWGSSTMQHGREVVVAVIDTGIDYTHEDLAANIWVNPDEECSQGDVGHEDKDGNGIVGDCHGANFVNPFKPTGNPMDDQAHGTHCAGVIGAVPDNGIGVAGVNANVKLMAVKFLSASGSGTLEGAIAGIDYAISKGAMVMSNSWGGGGSESPNLKKAVERASQANAVFISAAGNDMINNNDWFPSWPCNMKFASTACVASTNDRDWISLFSNFGEKTVDLAAPGSNILSTVPGHRYASMSGTSMATPLAAGIAASIVSELGPDYKASDVIDLLMETSETVGWWAWPIPIFKKVRSGGIVSAPDALLSAMQKAEESLFKLI